MTMWDFISQNPYLAIGLLLITGYIGQLWIREWRDESECDCDEAIADADSSAQDN